MPSEITINKGVATVLNFWGVPYTEKRAIAMERAWTERRGKFKYISEREWPVCVSAYGVPNYYDRRWIAIGLMAALDII